VTRPGTDKEAVRGYLAAVHGIAWAWADQKHVGQLDGGRRDGRWPVLKQEFAEMNVLVPQDGNRAAECRALIAPAKRHRHFGSLRSSQALAQSVLGAIAIYRRLDLLSAVRAECGRPAFFMDDRGWSLEFEHEVNTLKEPRRTSIDVLLSGANWRIAVECKFTETEFGTCSRPRLKPDDPQRCDGSYRPQARRTDRCALTAIGIDYWVHLPRLFAWPADRDHDPCPFGAVYQLARNALAAVVTPDGEVVPDRGHVLVVYDARNPAFQADGEANTQWEAAVAASLVPGLLRRLSWQRLLTVMDAAPDLVWLLDALGDKYGLVPNSG
jgi:hypothetical protein